MAPELTGRAALEGPGARGPQGVGGTRLQDSGGPALCPLVLQGPDLQVSGARAVTDRRQDVLYAGLGFKPHSLSDPLPELLRLSHPAFGVPRPRWGSRDQGRAPETAFSGGLLGPSQGLG